MKVFQSISLGLIFLMAGVFLLSSCGNKADTPETKKAELERLISQKNDLELQIKELQKELSLLDSGSDPQPNAGKVVTIKELVSGEFVQFIDIQGTVESDRNVQVTSEVGGTVKRISIREGQQVTAGQILFEVDDVLVTKNLQELETAYALAKDLFDRQQKLWEQQIGSEVQFLQAKNNKESLEKKMETVRTQLAKTRVTAPFSGVVDKVLVKEGEMASPGMPAVRIVDNSKVKVIANASEVHVGKIKKGDAVTVRFPALNMEKKAVVASVGQVINPNNRTFEVEISLENTNLTLKPNLLAVIRFTGYRAENVVTVPTGIIHFTDEETYVFVAENKDQNSVARKRKIESGKSFNGETEILTGVAPGEKIILAGFNEVSDGDALNIKPAL